jgi:hypothetical protein
LVSGHAIIHSVRHPFPKLGYGLVQGVSLLTLAFKMLWVVVTLVAMVCAGAVEML